MGKKKGGKGGGGEDYWSTSFEADQLAIELEAEKKAKKLKNLAANKKKASRDDDDAEDEDVDDEVVDDEDEEEVDEEEEAEEEEEDDDDEEEADDEDAADDDAAPAAKPAAKGKGKSAPPKQQQPAAKQSKAPQKKADGKPKMSVDAEKAALARARLQLGATGQAVGGAYKVAAKKEPAKKDGAASDAASSSASSAASAASSAAAAAELARQRDEAVKSARAKAEAAVEAKFAEQLKAFDDIDARSSDDEAAAAAAPAEVDEAPPAAAKVETVKDAWDDSSSEDEAPVVDAAERKRQAAAALAAAKAAKEERRKKRTELRALLQQISKQKTLESDNAAAVVMREAAAQDEAEEEPIDSEALRSPICCVLGHVDTGKCLARDTPVLMHDGSLRAVQLVKNGERVMGDDGLPRTVSGVTQGRERMARIVAIGSDGADDATAFVCNLSHVLSLKLADCPRRRAASITFAVAQRNDDGVAFRLTMREQAFRSERDAIRALATLSGLALATGEQAVAADETVDIAVKHFLDTSCVDERVRETAKLFHAAAPMQFASPVATVAAGADDAFAIGERIATLERVPEWLKRGSVELRQRLMAGVFASAGSDELTLQSAALRADVEFVARSLGMCVTAGAAGALVVRSKDASMMLERFAIQLVEPTSDGAWRVLVADAHAALCAVAARATTTTTTTLGSKRERSATTFDVDDIAPSAYGVGDFFGFQVDCNGRFVVGERFFVTHNTKLLDRIRRTNVQGGEAGGITQQIGATYFPLSTLQEQTAQLQKDGKSADIRVPGLLVIDTPGHESFTNLRSRGSSLCDMAILVVDLMHGLEPQTIESIKLLRQKKTPFVVAMNKVDRCVDWKPVDGQPIRNSLKRQSRAAMQQFEEHTKMIVGQFAAQEINVELYWKNKDFRKYVSLVPTSAISGEGVPDLLLLMIQLMQKMLTPKLQQKMSLNCTVLEVKVVEGLGTTIDVVLVDGVLREGDTIVVCGLSGAIVTTIRALLTPQLGKELRVKGTYVHHKKLRGAVGVKIAANDLDGAIAGAQLFVAKPGDDVEALKEEVMSEVSTMLSQVDHTGRGVCVQASTLGSLEALLQFLRDSKIPVNGVSIGPVHRKDVMRASIMLERERELAVLLAFDVRVTPEARAEADKIGVRIFEADIIYNLFDMFTDYMTKEREKRRKEASDTAVFPAIVKVLKCFNKSDPVVIGCEVVEGRLRLGTPITVMNKLEHELGRVTSIERDHKAVEFASPGDQVAVKIVAQTPAQHQRQHGRHFNDDDQLVSVVSRASIDALKEHFKDDITNEDKVLLLKLRTLFKLPKGK